MAMDGDVSRGTDAKLSWKHDISMSNLTSSGSVRETQFVNVFPKRYLQKLRFAMPLPKMHQENQNQSNSRPKGITITKTNTTSFPLPLRTLPTTPTIRLKPLPLAPAPILPLRTQHFPLYAVNNAHGDKEVVAVGAEVVAGAAETVGCWVGEV